MLVKLKLPFMSWGIGWVCSHLSNGLTEKFGKDMEGRPRTAVNASCVPFNFCVICSYNTDFSVIFATDFSGLRIIFPDKFGDCLVLLHILKAFTL